MPGREQPRTRHRLHSGRNAQPGAEAPRSPAARRRRRLVIGAAAVVLVGLLGVGGVFLYGNWRFSEIPKVNVPGLTSRVAGEPFDVLLVGSDSRQFVDSSAEADKFGSSSGTAGQRSDVVIVARVAPAMHEVELLSIPRDTYVDIPGDVSGISGPNRINAAFNSGPALLVKTIESSFHIPLSDYAEVNFPGFAGIVNALGGINLNFAYPVRDTYSGLSIHTTGCQLVMGNQALALVRSRHLYYDRDGEWLSDPGSDWSRIQRQDVVFRALEPKLSGVATSLTGLNALLGALPSSLSIDTTLGKSTLISLAENLHGSTLESETLPTIPYTTGGGADVLLPAAEPDATMIDRFLAFGTKSSAATTAYETPAPEGSVHAVLTAAAPVTVTTIATPANPGDVVYNTQAEPWNPVPCSR